MDEVTNRSLWERWILLHSDVPSLPLLRVVSKYRIGVHGYRRRVEMHSDSGQSSWLSKPADLGNRFVTLIDELPFRCWSQLQPNKTVLVGLRGEGRQLFTPGNYNFLNEYEWTIPSESPRPCTSQSNVHSTTASAIINNSTFTYLPLIISFLAGIIIGVGIIIVLSKVIEYCRDKRSERKRFDISQYSFVADRKWFIWFHICHLIDKQRKENTSGTRKKEILSKMLNK